MKSALALLLGVSVLGLAVGCDPASTEDAGTGGKIAVGTAGATTAGTGTTGGSGGGSSADGVAITPADGWVDVMSNALGIQGAMFSYGDETSKMGMTEDFTGANACIKGTAAEVIMGCTPVAPATDCYGTYWGAAIGLNLNQPKDEATGKGVEMPLPFDASSLKGFSFTITGAVVPTSLRFKVEDAANPVKEYCTWKTISSGTNTVLFSELETECWNHTKKAGTSAETVKSGLVKIAWQVVTKGGATIPFDYCVSDVRALTTGAAPTGGTAGASGTAGAASGTAGAGSGTAGAASGTAGAASGTAGAASGGSGGESGGTGGAATAGTGGAGTGGAATAGSGGSGG